MCVRVRIYHCSASICCFDTMVDLRDKTFGEMFNVLGFGRHEYHQWANHSTQNTLLKTMPTHIYVQSWNIFQIKWVFNICFISVFRIYLENFSPFSIWISTMNPKYTITTAWSTPMLWYFIHILLAYFEHSLEFYNHNRYQ